MTTAPKMPEKLAYRWTHKPSGQQGELTVVRGAYYHDLDRRVYTMTDVEDLLAGWNSAQPEKWSFVLVGDRERNNVGATTATSARRRAEVVATSASTREGVQKTLTANVECASSTSTGRSQNYPR